MSTTGQPGVGGLDTFRLCFIGGAFGTGKSTLCRGIAETLSARHVKASELIQFRPRPSDSTGKAVNDVDGNQERLLAAIDALRATAGTVLLDGHFCLWDSNHVVVRVPLDIFRQLNPLALVLMEANANEVVARLTQRDGRRVDPALIQKLLDDEREHAQSVANALDVPLFVTDGSSPPRAIADQLRSILGGLN